MIKTSEYYKYINERLIVKNEMIFRNCDIKRLCLLELPKEAFSKLICLLDRVEVKYGFDMQKMCQPNYNKFYIWQDNFCNKVNIYDLMIATEFVVFCCLADKILDSMRFGEYEKDMICEKLNIKNFISENKFESNAFQEMDILLNDIREFLCSYRARKSIYYNCIVNKMQKAFISEIYMYKEKIKNQESMSKEKFQLLVDKSVEFEIVAFLFASFSNNSKNSERAANLIAKIFWLIDDLCDFVDDIKCCRKNSLLYYKVEKETKFSLNERVEIALKYMNLCIEELENYLFELKNQVSAEMYNYVVNEIWEWCKDVRKFTE